MVSELMEIAALVAVTQMEKSPETEPAMVTVIGDPGPDSETPEGKLFTVNVLSKVPLTVNVTVMSPPAQTGFGVTVVMVMDCPRTAALTPTIAIKSPTLNPFKILPVFFNWSMAM